VSRSNFNPRDTKCIPAVKIFDFLDLEQTGNPPRRGGTARNLIAKGNSVFFKGLEV
jgi:hypothetical protein